MSEGKPDKTREDVRAPTETGEVPVRPGAPVLTQQVSESRRRFAKAGLLASPILMSVASRPVFGAPCLSNILSGNLSDPERGQCIPGDSPDAWKSNPGFWPGGVSPGGLMVDKVDQGTAAILGDCRDCVDEGVVEIIGGLAIYVDLDQPKEPDNEHKLNLVLKNGRKQHFYITRVYVQWPAADKGSKEWRLIRMSLDGESPFVNIRSSEKSLSLNNGAASPMEVTNEPNVDGHLFEDDPGKRKLEAGETKNLLIEFDNKLKDLDLSRFTVIVDTNPDPSADPSDPNGFTVSVDTTPDPSADPSAIPKSWICEDGTKFSDVFDDDDPRQMHEILCSQKDADYVKAAFIAAWLNALTNPDYILNQGQLLDLWKGVYDHAVLDKKALLESTW